VNSFTDCIREAKTRKVDKPVIGDIPAKDSFE
jgi:hypothetical protein